MKVQDNGFEVYLKKIQKAHIPNKNMSFLNP
jgi:hypothetical protein